jgi:hypothetical protein
MTRTSGHRCARSTGCPHARNTQRWRLRCRFQTRVAGVGGGWCGQETQTRVVLVGRGGGGSKLHKYPCKQPYPNLQTLGMQRCSQCRNTLGKRNQVGSGTPLGVSRTHPAAGAKPPPYAHTDTTSQPHTHEFSWPGKPWYSQVNTATWPTPPPRTHTAHLTVLHFGGPLRVLGPKHERTSHPC